MESLTRNQLVPHTKVCSDVLRLLLNASWAEFVSADSVFSPSPKRMESNSMPPENEPNKWKSCWYQGCTLIVLFFLTKSNYLNLMKWLVDAGSIAQLVFSWWTNNQHTCVLKVSIEIIERYELDTYGEMLRVFTADDARILCLYLERHYKVRQRIHHDSLNSFENVSWEEAWERLDHWSFSFHSFFINKKQILLMVRNSGKLTGWAW